MRDFNTLSYKRDMSNVMSWEDIHFRAVNKAIDEKIDVNYEGFKAAVNALDATCDGFKDEEYDKDIFIMRQEARIFKENGKTSADVEQISFSEKFRILCRLLFRFYKGKIKTKEYVNDSEVAKELAYKLNKGNGQFVLFTGPPRIGKSNNCIRLAQEVTKLTGGKFIIKKNIKFEPEKFMQAFNDIHTCPSGSALIYEEVGVTYNSRDALSSVNKIINKFLQTAAHKGILVIFNTPDLSYIDSAGKKLLHFWFEVTRLNESNNCSYAKPHKVEVIQRTGEIIYPYPRKNETVITEVRFDKISKKDFKAYRELEKEWKDDLAISSQLQIVNINKQKDEDIFKKYVALRNDKDKPRTRTEAKEELKLTSYKASKFEKMYNSINDLSRYK